ncbi:MAG: polyphosphate kinase 1 [Oscillospiraceae bacterium]|nr:polyphosphate kinase 1 [Oscillospiraceae bacterium]
MAEEIRNYTQNRELSWLAFNARVLDEATDPMVPLLERLKFVAIFTSNLDEFFMIRVGSLYDIAALGNTARDSRTGMTAAEQLERIYAAMGPLYARRDRVYRALQQELCTWGICSVSPYELTPREKKYLKNYFREQVLPLLSPQIVDPSHPFPHLGNKELYIIANLTRKKETMMGIVPVPSMLPEVVYLPGEDLRFISMENLLLTFLDLVFDQYQVSDKNCICVTRNADISPDDELFDVEEDFRCHMKKLLHKRRRMAVVRVETAYPMEKHLEAVITRQCSVEKSQIFQTAAPMKMGYVYALLTKVPPAMGQALLYPPFTPQDTLPAGQGSMLKLVRKRDVLLSFPYESMDPFLRMLREAASDPDVVSIRITIYRLARNARLVEYLCAAAENGKEVTVLIELRARFDEQNNIDWSERLEAAGCRILYGFETYKVHSKVCLITMRGKHGAQYITQIGTGNYNEKTAALYTDLSLITADPGIGADAARFFKNMAIGNLNGSYDHLLVSPVSFRQTLLELIAGETAKGEAGHIVIKCNSVTDCDLIRSLSRASRAGVRVELIVRGICCILPGVPGYTEHITVTSLVGRYLEHARIYAFGDGAERKLFIGSADMMTRNTERRVEVVTPVYDPALKQEIGQYLDIQLRDTVKARELLSDGTYRKKDPAGETLCAQEWFMADAVRRAGEVRRAEEHRPSAGDGLFARLLVRFHGNG